MLTTARHDGAATRLRRALALVLCVAAPLVLGGCHDEQRLRERLEGPPARLPVEPDQPNTPPAPALLDTIEPWRQPPGFGPRVTAAWSVISNPITDEFELTYRVPTSWEDRGAGAARNAQQQVEVEAALTELRDADISLATYAAQLADGNPIYQYPTEDGHIVYLTRREVELAPTDEHAPVEVFHSAVLSIDGRIAKLDVSYDRRVDWRYDEVATAITGTLQVRSRAE